MDRWRVARDGFMAHPIEGSGAGTYRLLWERNRPTDSRTNDAHSLYLETLAELGLVGGVLLAVALLAILGGFAVRSRGRGGTLYAALLAAGLVWAIHAALDWDWELPAVTLWLFAAGGIALAAPAGRAPGRTPGWPARLLVTAGLALVAVTPVRVALSQADLSDSVRSYASGRCEAGIDSARKSISALGDRPEPYEVLGYCQAQLRTGDHGLAAMEDAVQRDPKNWEYHYGLALVRAAVGKDPRHEAAVAFQRNPRERLTREALARFRAKGPRAWRRAATSLGITPRGAVPRRPGRRERTRVPVVPVRVLLCLHHRLDRNLGAPAVTLELGAALERAGCEVEFYSFDDSFEGGGGAPDQLRFPWHVAGHLLRSRSAFDVVDAATGDAWVWASLGRPRGSGTALVTRAHGLEHVADERNRRIARRAGPPLSWKYPVYHGGLRLWEVRRSLRLSDRCILLNRADRDYVRDRLGVPEERLTVIPNGIAEAFHRAPPPARGSGPLRLAFVGRWSAYKGKHTLLEALAELERQGHDFSLSLLGTGISEDAVLTEIPGSLRGRVSVVPAFANERLPGLLAGHELFVFPSLSEGSSASLLEAMACGLAPVATAVGAAENIVDDSSGVLVAPGDSGGIAAAVGRLAGDRDALLGLRRRAREIARRYRWDDVASRTLEVYERALATRSTASRKRGATVSHV